MAAGGTLLPKLTLAGRRSILFALPLAVGALAAALPILLGEPATEHPALRGLAALVLAFLAAVFLAARWGSRGPLPPRAHLLELAKVAAAVTALLLPALLAGMTTAEAKALATLAQTTIGWTRPIAAPSLALWLLVAAYVVARLRSSGKEERLAGSGLIWLSVIVVLALIGVSALRLGQIPSPAGIELLSKVVLLLVLSTLAVAALVPPESRRRDRGADLRTIALAVGFVLIGWSTSYGTYRYLRPTERGIERILYTSGDALGTTFAAALEGRPDIYGLFSLDYASATPRLELVRPVGTYVEFLIEKTAQTGFGTARLEPRPELKNRWSELLPPPVDESFVEIWIRLRWWPWTDFRPGLHLREPVYDWAVAPNWTFAVASTYVRSPDVWPNARYGEMDQGTYAVDIWRVGRKSQRLLDDLPLPPRILALSGDSVALLVSGQSYSRGRLHTASARPAIRRDGAQNPEATASEDLVLATSHAPAPSYFATTTCDLRAWSCEPWKTGGRARPRVAPSGSLRMMRGPGGWSATIPDSAEVLFPLPPCEVCSANSDFAYTLRDGRVVRLSLRGSMPNWDSLLTAYDVDGRETAATSLGNVRLTHFAGALDDGSVAIAWRSQYGRSPTAPLFGWTLDSWNLLTGERRRLADDLGTFPSSENDASMIFLDRRFRLVVPTVGGVRVLAQLKYSLPEN